MKNSLSPFSVLVPLVLFFCTSWSQADKELKSKCILLRAPEFNKDCTKGDQSKSVSVGNANVSFEIGDRFQIITHRSGVRNAKVTDNCTPSISFEASEFLFTSMDYVGWDGEYDALLGIRGDNIQSDQVGSVAGIRLNHLYRATVFDALKGYVPSTDTILAEYATLISPPNSFRLFLFVPIEHFDPRIILTAGDKAISYKGIIFEIRGQGILSIMVENTLQTVYSISDADDDGVWEILVHCGDWGGGSYELRFFDGNHFQKEKLQLYEWSH